jgi:hypothetical protein
MFVTTVIGFTEMKISEKQVMQLMGVAEDFVKFMTQPEDKSDLARARYVSYINDLLESITDQQSSEEQSEELKEIE